MNILCIINRITGSTCQDLKVKYNQLLERNVYLQQEVENKMELTVTIQRLKDELKGIKCIIE